MSKFARCAAIYVRYSSDNQRHESIDAQIRAIKKFCKANGYEIVKIYKDEAKTATSDKRPQFQQMIKDSSLGSFETVIVHKLDRFARNRHDSVTYKMKLKNNGVRLLSVIENLDDSPESIMMESLYEGMAEYFSVNLSREVRKGMNETALQCKHTGGAPPLGYDVGLDKKYIINEEEAIIVKLIFVMYISGHSYGSMIDKLNEKGYRTKKGKSFGKNSLHGILSNEKYSGVYVYNRSSKKDIYGRRNNHRSKDDSEIIRIEGGMPAIISKEDFQKAREMMAKRKKAPGANSAKEHYLLQGLVKCGHCGSSMNGNRRKPKNKPKYVSYRCGTRLQKRTCDNKEIRKEYIEEFVLSELEKNILNDAAVPAIVDKMNSYFKEQSLKSKATITHMKKELVKINSQIDNIVAAIADGFYQEEFKNKLDDLKGRKSNIEYSVLEEERIKDMPKITEVQVKALFGRVKEFVKTRDIPECKKFIQNYVDSVIVYKDRVEVIFNVVFSFLENAESVSIKTKIKKRELIQRYSNSFYLKISV